jgi:hypothetical protein
MLSAFAAPWADTGKRCRKWRAHCLRIRRFKMGNNDQGSPIRDLMQRCPLTRLGITLTDADPRPAFLSGRVAASLPLGEPWTHANSSIRGRYRPGLLPRPNRLRPSSALSAPHNLFGRFSWAIRGKFKPPLVSKVRKKGLTVMMSHQGPMLIAVVFGRDIAILPGPAAAEQLISVMVTRPVCLGGPSPFKDTRRRRIHVRIPGDDSFQPG